MPASVRCVMVALALLSSLVPMMSRTVSAQSAIELYRSDEFDYFFFYDTSRWEVVEQESEPGADFARFSDGDISVSYLAFAAPGVTPGDCIEGLLDSLFHDPSILAYEAFTEEGGPAEIRDAGSWADVELVVTVDGSDGRFKLATYEQCVELVPGQSLLYTSVNVPAASANAGRGFETPWIRGYLPRDELIVETAPVPVFTVNGELRGSLQATISCGDVVDVVARSFGGGGNFIIDRSAFVAAYASGESLVVPVEWLAPDVSSASSLLLEPDEVGLFSLDIPDTNYEILYAPPDGPPIVIGERGGACPRPAAVANPVIIDMDE